MRSARAKRLLLGAAALVAPLPMPFNGVLGWAVLVLFELAVLWFIYRAWQGESEWLPVWAMNLLALAYLPVLVVDFSALWRGRVLEPLVHLAMFTLAVKLFALKREKDKWHATVLIFFLFLAAMGSSVHPTIVVYLTGFLLLALLLLVRFAGYHEGARAGSTAGSRRVPVGGYVAVTTLLTLLGAVPIFILLPRLRQPYLVAPGVSGGGGQVTGFSDRMTLDTIGRVRSNSGVAFRFAFDNPEQTLAEYRFKGGVYDLFVGNGWRRSPRRQRSLRRSPSGFFQVGEGRYRVWQTIWLRRSEGSRLVLPVETVALDVGSDLIAVEDTGLVAALGQPAGTGSYRAGIAGRAATEWPSEGASPPGPADLDPRGSSERIDNLAAEVMGEGTPIEQAERAEAFLIRNYGYTRDLGMQTTDSPVERFLFDTRRGHCEYFASAMVLMLRSRGIPARVVTGYYGAEYNPLEGYFIVRHSNAHAWAEGWIPGRGWLAFDPTPPAGLPQQEPTDWRQLAQQAYDYMLFRWDRYVLTYGFSDQAGVLFRLRDLWLSFWEELAGSGDEAPSAPLSDSPALDLADPAEEPARSLRGPWLWLPFALFVAAAALWFWLKGRRLDGARAYRALRAALERGGPPLSPALAPGEVARRLARRCPEAGEPVGRVIELYLEESFGGRELEERELERLRRALDEARRRLRGRRAA